MTLTEQLSRRVPDGTAPTWFDRLARFSVRRRRTVMAVWLLVVLVAAPLALTLTGGLSSAAGWERPGSVAEQVRDELRADFPNLGAESAIVVYRQTDPIAQDATGLRSIVRLQDAPAPPGSRILWPCPPKPG